MATGARLQETPVQELSDQLPEIRSNLDRGRHVSLGVLMFTSAYFRSNFSPYICSMSHTIASLSISSLE